MLRKWECSKVILVEIIADASRGDLSGEFNAILAGAKSVVVCDAPRISESNQSASAVRPTACRLKTSVAATKGPSALSSKREISATLADRSLHALLNKTLTAKELLSGDRFCPPRLTSCNILVSTIVSR
jgi:hypothetical protein